MQSPVINISAKLFSFKYLLNPTQNWTKKKTKQQENFRRKLPAVFFSFPKFMFFKRRNAQDH